MKEFQVPNKTIRAFHLVANAGIYMALLRDIYPFNFIPETFSIGLSVFSLLVILFCIFFSPKNRSGLELLFYDFIGLTFILIVPLGPSQFRTVLFYHIVWWLLYPLNKLSKPKARNYVLSNLVFVVFFFVLTPYLKLTDWGDSTWLYYSYLFGNAHISVSFILSKSNPSWLISLLNLNKANVSL